MQDPLWYKDAIIYELHVRAFMDGNNDGIGDFPGLMQKLDYLQDLGVTCLWLLPFFPSPLRDDGYDISDYMTVHPNYGTVEDFKAFLDAAHERDMQVMIELVVNHTSDQHPWFQRARLAPPGSPEREFYVWSDTDKKYEDARIIFTDTEKSNWTWDPVAKQYFWHRFFSHQPDLNYDNPQVTHEVLNIMRFWLDMGVDGLRVDAIPYLVEREGTSCENLPETHAVMKRVRAAIDESYSGRMILAEANQWPTDVRAYFGDGDECHMAFHFPLMPRIYMALRQEDRLPITDILAQTPEIPDNCQWGLFLRNHDELTLEMVTDEERDYMYLAYSADPRMRINIGIRRRLAPLVDNNRRRIELLNSLLFSFPGTPILYYGDEIGMGDNIYLGDRNGVRTPMQWSGDRNAGFSRANPARLYSPVVMDPVWGYEAVNVEAQQSDQSSLLNWMRNMIALRKLFRVFGRGTLKFLEPENRKILAYLRELDGEIVLCVANLSRFAQPVQLDLSELEGMIPVEMLGYVEFPAIGKQHYPLTLAPYGFLWLELQGTRQAASPEHQSPAEEELVVAGPQDWHQILTGSGRAFLEKHLLPEFLPKQRWFGGKSRRIVSTSIVDTARFNENNSALILLAVSYESGEPDTYLMPLGMASGGNATELQEKFPSAVVSPLTLAGAAGVLYDGLYNDDNLSAFLALISGGGKIQWEQGTAEGLPSSVLGSLRGEGSDLRPRRSSAEQSNSSILFGEKLIMKLFRRQQSGLNPDTEIGRFLTERTGFRNIAPFGGSIEYRSGSDLYTLAMLQGLVANEGDGWQWTLEELDRYYESRLTEPFPNAEAETFPKDFQSLSHFVISKRVRDDIGFSLDAAATLGRRTGELHVALASDTEDEAFAPLPIAAADVQALQEQLLTNAARAFDALKDNLARLPDDTVEAAGLILSRRRAFFDRLRKLVSGVAGGMQTRIHGDYHLGQVLRTKSDFVILDFEGEPARSLEERRAKQSPLKDVAGMLRSFSYAAFASLSRYTTRRPQDAEKLEPWTHLWEQAVTAEYLKAYRDAVSESSIVPNDARSFEALLKAYVLDKALYELVYELNNRPTWVRIPLNGILSLTL
ncbi:Trehalose synthase [Acidisarcina polymorpha]|uniref:Maltokinase n=1 Tax=Acidisarcina polymorpha TaxID=2211140 RepID=A0A2Z5G7F8_9BACT|nr:Trehalose synthase [Acidisarcina polymorpha]